MKLAWIALLVPWAASALPPAEEKLLVLHADDLAVLHSVNEASFLGITTGAVSSASILMPVEAGLPEVVEFAKREPQRDLGVHLALNSEWDEPRWSGVAGVAAARSLHDLWGFLWRDPLETLLFGRAGEVELELRAQILRARELGLNPSHMDTHMGTSLMKPEFIRAYAKVARELGIPCFLPKWNEELEKKIRARGLLTGPFKKVYDEEHLEELAWIDSFTTLTYDLEAKTMDDVRAKYDQAIRDVRPGVTELIVHLSWDDESSREMQRLKPGELNRRYADLVYFSDPATAELLKAQGIRLVTWRELAELNRR